MTKADEEKLRRSERKILRKIFSLHYDPNSNQYRVRTNAEIRKLYGDGDIIKEIKSQRLRWYGHVHRLRDDKLTMLIWKEAVGKKATWKATPDIERQHQSRPRKN